MNLAGLHENVASAAGAGSFPATGELKRGRGRPKKIDERFDGSKSSSTPSVVPKQYPCDWPHCGMWFTQSSNLNKHYLTHTDEKPFKCLWPNCDKSFKQSSNLNKHRLVHTGLFFILLLLSVINKLLTTGEKPFSCDYPECNKRFSQSSNLKKHKLVHSGEWIDQNVVLAIIQFVMGTGDKPYRCEYPGCTKMFDQSSNLNKHFLTHVGQKPHVCSECGDKFSQSSNLTKHMRQRHGHYPGVQQSQPVLQSQQLAGSGNFLASNGETSATTPLANGIAISSSTASAMAVAAAAIEAGGGRLVVLPNPPVCYPNNVKNHQSHPHHQLMNDLTSGEVSNAVAVAANAFFSNATSQGKINFDGFDPKFISGEF